MLNGPILALDADQDIYAVVTYRLLGAHSSLFDIDNSTGEASAALGGTGHLAGSTLCEDPTYSQRRPCRGARWEEPGGSLG